MKRQPLILLLSLTLFSCNKWKKKGRDEIHKIEDKAIETKQNVLKKKQQLADAVFPSYDSDRPDTDNNKKRFKESLQIDLTDDVKNIYTYGDFLGADYKILIAFHCDITTIDKIVRTKSMTLSTEQNDDGLLFHEKFHWWDPKVIHSIRPFKVGKENEFWQYFWFDRKTKTAYYEEFSL